MGRRPSWEYNTDHYRKRVRELHRLHPTWTGLEIANHLNISEGTVSNYLKKYREHRKYRRQQDCA